MSNLNPEDIKFSKSKNDLSKNDVDDQAQNKPSNPAIANIDFEALNKADIAKEVSEQQAKYQQAKREFQK